jgi:ABC-type branched-subunit amino acid transport system substrate-binding protein
MIERDKVACIIGEISSASALTIGQVAERTKTFFINTGANSDQLRGKSCNKYMFHIESQNSMYVKTCGRSLMAQGLVRGKKWFSLTADYAFGHDLLRVAKKFMAANGGEFAADKLVPTDATDFSPLLLEIRNAKPDLVISNLAGNQITNFLKQYSEFGLTFPTAGFGFDTAVAWAAGKGNFSGTWPLVWHHLIETPASKKFVADFTAATRSRREPGVGRLQRDQARRAGDDGDQVDRVRQARRALREGSQVPADEDARGLLPQVRPPDDARDVHDQGAARRADQERVGHLHVEPAGAERQRAAGGDRDAGG